MPPGFSGANEKTANTILATKKYFVSPAGNDTSNGLSPATAWKTLAKVNTQQFLPGDQVLLEGGKTFNGYLNIISSGISGQNIRFASYGTGKATISAGGGIGVYIYNSSFITVDSLIITGTWNALSQTGNNSHGILFYTDLPGGIKLGDVAVLSCDVSGFQKSGITFLSYPADQSQSGYRNIRVTSCKVFANGAVGIATQGRSAPAGNTAYAFNSVFFGGNRVYDNLGIKSNISSHSGDGILIGDAASGLVQGNIAFNNGWYNAASAGGPAAIWCYDSKNIIFQYNEAHHNGTGAGKPDGDGFDLDGGAVNCTMQYNYSHDNYAAGLPGMGIWKYKNKKFRQYYSLQYQSKR